MCRGNIIVESQVGFYFLRDWVVGYSSLKEAKTELVHAIYALHEKKEYERKSKKER